MNSIMQIAPYRTECGWAFDDPSRGLLREPFVAGADTALDRLVAGFENQDSCVLTFSAAPFPGADYQLHWTEGDEHGNYYDLDGSRLWLCPALLRYFDKAPSIIHLQVRGLTGDKTK